MLRTKTCKRGHERNATIRQCGECIKLWRRRNKKKISAYGKKYHKRHKKKRRAKSKENHLLTNYGLTMKEYRAILKAQNGVCAICYRTCPTGRSLAVDHDHETLKVRGLLCFNCNTRLHALENEKTFKAMKRYLERAH